MAERLKRKQVEAEGSEVTELPVVQLGSRGTAAEGGRRVAPSVRFNGVKVFSATMMADRIRLGETVTNWIAANGHVSIADIVVTQSSDSAFHCVAISVFYLERLTHRS